MFCLLVVFVRLSVPVQVIDWKDSSPNDLCVDGDVIPYSLTLLGLHHWNGSHWGTSGGARVNPDRGGSVTRQGG